MFSQDKKQYAEEVLTEGFELLKTAWAHHAQHEAKCPELFKKMEPLFANINFFSHVLGMYEINNHDIELPHPISRCLSRRVPELYQQNTPEAHAEIQVIQSLLIELKATMDVFWDSEATGNFHYDKAQENESDNAEIGDDGLKKNFPKKIFG